MLWNIFSLALCALYSLYEAFCIGGLAATSAFPCAPPAGRFQRPAVFGLSCAAPRRGRSGAARGGPGRSGIDRRADVPTSPRRVPAPSCARPSPLRRAGGGGARQRVAPERSARGRRGGPRRKMHTRVRDGTDRAASGAPRRSGRAPPGTARAAPSPRGSVPPARSRPAPPRPVPPRRPRPPRPPRRPRAAPRLCAPSLSSPRAAFPSRASPQSLAPTAATTTSTTTATRTAATPGTTTRARTTLLLSTRTTTTTTGASPVTLASFGSFARADGTPRRHRRRGYPSILVGRLPGGPDADDPSL